MIVGTFYDIQRGRRYTGMGDPLPLSVGDISDYLTAHPCDMPRYEFDAAIIAADNMLLEQWAERNK